MLRRCLAAAVVLSGVWATQCTGAEDGELRTWTSTRGQTLRARFIRATGGTVTLRSEDGKDLQIRRSALSVDDQRLLNRLSGDSAGGRPGGGATDAEWPGWRGPNRDGKSADRGLLRAWPAGGPKRLWHATGLGEGFSGVAVADGTIYITGVSGGTLNLIAFDLNGQEKWRVEHGPAWSRNYKGGRATPTIDGNRLYLFSGPGKIACYDTTDGRALWSHEAGEYGGEPGGWGYAESVLIDGDMAVFSPGRDKAMVALNKADGSTIWTSHANGGGAHYSSAIAVTCGGVRMFVNGNGGGIYGVRAKDGQPLWDNDFSRGNTANCPTPAYEDGYVFWANGYGKGGICLKLSGGGGRVTAREAWRTKDMICHHGGYVIHNGYIYGNHEGGWACLELKSGEKKWNEKGVGKGSLCFADGLLFLFSEHNGRVGLAEARPDTFELTGDFSVEGKGPSWAHPVVTGGRLYLRYDDNLYCFDVRGES